MIAVMSSTDLWTYLPIPNVLQMTGVSNLVTRFNLHGIVYNDRIAIAPPHGNKVTCLQITGFPMWGSISSRETVLVGSHLACGMNH